MAFLRDILRVPIPKVLAYSTDSNNPVGTEYIIMERIEGVSLASRWLSLATGEVKDIMTQIAAIEQKLFAHSFPGYGSLYHRRDLQGDLQIPLPLEDYCIGPISARQFWHGDRSATKIDRGPCELVLRIPIAGKTSYHCDRALAQRLLYIRCSPSDRLHIATCKTPTTKYISTSYHFRYRTVGIYLTPLGIPETCPFVGTNKPRPYFSHSATSGLESEQHLDSAQFRKDC